MKKSLGAYTALLIGALYLPIAVMIVFSFNSGEQIVVWKGFTIDWYRRALENHEARTAFIQSMTIGLTSTVLAVILGTFAALASVRLDFRGKKAFNLLLSIPMTIPDVLMGMSLFVFFIAIGTGLGYWTVIIAHTTFSLAYVAVVVAARLQGLDRSIELAAQDLGATPAGAFFKVTLPAVLPAVISGALLAFTLSFDDVVITYFTKSERVNTLPMYLYSKIHMKFTPEVNALSTLMLAGSIVLVVAAMWLHKPALEGERK